MFLLELAHMKWIKCEISGDIPAARFGHCMHAISDDELILFGGFVSDITNGYTVSPPFNKTAFPSVISNDTYIFHIPTRRWHHLADLSGDIPSARSFFASSIMNGKLYIHGGFIDNESNKTSNELFELSWDSAHQHAEWKRLGDGLESRAGHCMVATQSGSLIMFGDHQRIDNTVYEFVGVDNVNIRAEALHVLNSPFARRFFSLLAVGNKVYCIGGDTGVACGSSDLYILDGFGDNRLRWSKPLYEHSLTIRGHAACVLGSDKVIVYGGIIEKQSLILAGHSDYSFSRKLFFASALEVRDPGRSTDGFKFVTVGDSGVGKSCLLTRFVSDVYNEQHVSTIGVDYKTILTMVKGRLVKLQLWDTAGQERFSVVTGNYYRNADVFVLVYDATCRSSFDHVDGWISQIKQHHDLGDTTVTVLCANKSDMVEKVIVSEKEGREKANQIGAIFVQTSAKTSSNVDSAFLAATQRLVEIRKTAVSQRPSVPSRGVNLATQIPNRLAAYKNQQACCS
jgi:Ras-related protein Rab-1A